MQTTSFQDLFAHMPIPRFIVYLEEGNYYISHANKMAYEYFNIIYSQNSNEVKPDTKGQSIVAFMGRDNANYFTKSFDLCVARKEAIDIQALSNRFKIYGFYIVPIIDKDSELLHLDVIGQLDVSDQSILQRERDDAISLLASVFEASEVGIVVTDQNSRIIRVNNSFVRIYGWAKDELISTEFSSLLTPDERFELRKKHDNSIKTGERYSGEVKIIKKDGAVANALYTAATLELSQKRRFQVTTVMDITLRKKMETSLLKAKDQADAANRAKSTFLANMSHELRTPLNAIIGFSEIIHSETFGEIGHVKYKEYLGDIVSSGHHLLGIINEVLDMSKIESGRIEMDEHEMDIEKLITSVVRMMDSKIFASDLTINTKFAVNLPKIMADERLIRQILINLLSNAVKFSTKGGDINVSAVMLDDGSLEVSVADQGLGIPKEKLQYVLEPFGQVPDHAQHRHDQGTGLGLPLAQAMVKLHQGYLNIESDVGKGTMISFNIPAKRVLR